MPNGDQLRELAARLDRLEQRWDKNKEARDGEASEVREAIATLDARQGEADRVTDRIGTQLQTLVDRKPPGALQLWGPTLSTAVALAALFVFVLNQDRRPLENDIHRVDEKVEEAKKTAGTAILRQWEIFGEQQYQKGRLDAMEERLRDVDMNGSRKWVGNGAK